MGAAVETTSEVEILESLDFDPDQVCEATKGCVNRAEFAMRCKACAATVLWCRACRVRFETRLAWLGDEAVVQCIYCRAETFDMAALFEWIPLRGDAS